MKTWSRGQKPGLGTEDEDTALCPLGASRTHHSVKDLWDWSRGQKPGLGTEDEDTALCPLGASRTHHSVKDLWEMEINHTSYVQYHEYIYKQMKALQSKKCHHSASSSIAAIGI